MEIIENFAELSEKEQREFAEAFIKTINSEHTFTAEVDFVVDDVEADDITGGLWIGVSHTDAFAVEREATWQAADEDEANSTPDDPEYECSIYDDIKSCFKTLSTEIDGYEVSLDISEVDEDLIEDVTVNDISYEDSGIGSYEYWGDIGYDSQPYVEVTGVLTTSCSCAGTFFVEAAGIIGADEEDNSEDGDFDPEGRREEKPWDSSKHFDD
jgi:hypothetical protein